MFSRFFILVLVLLCTSYTSVFSQNSKGKIIEISTQNPYTFLELISAFYPLNASMIEQYKEDLEWSEIEENQNIEWNVSFLKKWKHKFINQVWQRNPALHWTEELLEEYAMELDWFYVSQNPNLPVSIAFMERYENDVIWHFFSKNPAFLKNKEVVQKYEDKLELASTTTFSNDLLVSDTYTSEKSIPKELKKWKDAELKELPPNLITKYADLLQLDEYVQYAHFPWTIELFNQIDWSEYFICDYENLYNRLYKPFMSDAFVHEIFEHLNPKDIIPVYGMAIGNDEFGDYPKVHKGSGSPIIPDDSFMKNPKFPEFHLYNYWPPMRYADFHIYADNSKFANVIVVSPTLKKLLEKYRMAPHRFYPIQVANTDTLYGAHNISEPYFILHFLEDYEYLDYSKCTFQTHPYGDFPFKKGVKIDSYAACKKLKKTHNVEAENLIWDADYDIFATHVSRASSLVWISANLKEAMEAAHITGAQYLKFRRKKAYMAGLQSPENIDKTKRLLAETKAEFGNRKDAEQITILNFKKALERRKELILNKGIVKKMRQKEPLPTTKDAFLLKIRAQEEALDVVFPEALISILKDKKWNRRKHKEFSEYYEIMDIENLYSLSNDWSATCPFATKAVLFAEDGLGNYLGLILKEGSDYELDERVYYFEHEIGEILKGERL